MMKKNDLIRALDMGATLIIDEIYCSANVSHDGEIHVVRYDVAQRIRADKENYTATCRDGWCFCVYVTRKASNANEDNYFVVDVDNYDGTTSVEEKHYADVNVMFRVISKIYAFDDIDDTRHVRKIVCGGRECFYTGWLPCMHFVYRACDNREIVWEGWFEQWDH